MKWAGEFVYVQLHLSAREVLGEIGERNILDLFHLLNEWIGLQSTEYAYGLKTDAWFTEYAYSLDL
jgi:hypothetical protein